MPRRPRPTSRPPPRSEKRPRDEEEATQNEEQFREDRPRFSQWVPEEELDEELDEEELNPIPSPSSQPESDSGDGDELDSDSGSEGPVAESSKPKPEWTTAKRKRDIEKRSSKHAPTEITSKRPVSRHRPVVEVPTIPTRDPRFTPLSGTLSEPHFSRAYSFLPELQRTEATTLRASLAKARKQRAPFETIDKLERALKHAESALEKARRDEREREALSRVKKEEREKRGEGKGAWYMKKSEKRSVLLQAKFDDLAAHGGQNAVRKAIDKRKKKVAQKEKKARPFTKAQGRAFSQSQSAGGSSRSGWGENSRGDGGGDYKRRRV